MKILSAPISKLFILFQPSQSSSLCQRVSAVPFVGPQHSHYNILIRLLLSHGQVYSFQISFVQSMFLGSSCVVQRFPPFGVVIFGHQGPQMWLQQKVFAWLEGVFVLR